MTVQLRTRRPNSCEETALRPILVTTCGSLELFFVSTGEIPVKAQVKTQHALSEKVISRSTPLSSF